MVITGEGIILRDMIKDDLADYIRWNTEETEWLTHWDAPWEYTPETLEETENWCRTLVNKHVNIEETAPRRRFEICLTSGEHIGWMSSYQMDGGILGFAIGIDIPNPALRGQGCGTEAYKLFIKYLLDNGVNDIYTQTWSGNTPMIRLAEKTGFREIDRRVGVRTVHGSTYDALTFKFFL